MQRNPLHQSPPLKHKSDYLLRHSEIILYIQGQVSLYCAINGFFLVPSSKWVCQKKCRWPEPSGHLRINGNRRDPKHIQASKDTSWTDLGFPDLCPMFSPESTLPRQF